MVDYNCVNLAHWFLLEEPGLRGRTNELAAVIEAAIADWIAAERQVAAAQALMDDLWDGEHAAKR